MIVGFIGTGTMGAPIAKQLLAAGYHIRVFDQNESATVELVEAGATACSSAHAASEGSDVVMLSLPGPEHVVDALFGDDGALSTLCSRDDPSSEDRPAVVVDLSTNSPEVVQDVEARCAVIGVGFVDAPVSGGAVAARSGSLSIMIGGDAEHIELIRPCLEVIGSNLFHVGPSGSGTVAKLVNNQIFLGTGVLIQEAYVLAAKLGLSPSEIHPVVSASSAGIYAKLGPMLLGRQFDDVVFRMDIAAKDLQLAVDAADAAQVDTPVTDAVVGVYRAALEGGGGSLAFHATLEEIERRAFIELPPLERLPRRDSTR